MKNFFKSIIVGIGNIMPGISGSAILIIFGLYDKCISAISNLFKDFKKNILFLLPIALGIFVGTFAFSNIIEFCLNNFKVITSFIFLGLLLGTVPGLFKEANKKGFNYSYIIPFIITFTIGMILLFFNINYSFNLSINFLTLILIGFIVALSTIIPGISNTVLLTMLGVYDNFLNAINTLDFKLLIPIGIGIILGGFILAKIIDKLLHKYYGYTYFAILGFVISTLPALIDFNNLFTRDVIFGIILAIISFFITYIISKTDKKSI